MTSSCPIKTTETIPCKVRKWTEARKNMCANKSGESESDGPRGSPGLRSKGERAILDIECLHCPHTSLSRPLQRLPGRASPKLRLILLYCTVVPVAGIYTWSSQLHVIPGPLARGNSTREVFLEHDTHSSAHCLPPLLSQKPKISHNSPKHWPRKPREWNSPVVLGFHPYNEASRSHLGYVAAVRAELPS